MTIVCSSCHKDNPDGSKFCTSCGQRISAAPLSTNPNLPVAKTGGISKGVIGGVLGAVAVTAIGSGAWFYSQKPAEPAPAPQAAVAPAVQPPAAPLATPVPAAPAVPATPAAVEPAAPKAAKAEHKHAEKKIAQADTAKPVRPAASCKNCGVIESVQQISKPGEASGLGAVAGGVLGGVLGNQIGKGRGRDIATIAGAAGGAYAGHQVEKSQRTSSYYEISVRYNDGTRGVFKQDNAPSWQQGDPVRVENGIIRAR